MFRLINILLFTFLALTVFLIAIHIQKTVYYENPSKDIIEKIYAGQTDISIDLSKYENDSYRFNLSFSDIKKDIIVNDINIKLEKVNWNKSTSLELIKILPYSGMHNWDMTEFRKFSKIPTELRTLNTQSNPYFAFDFIFKKSTKKEEDKFLAKINLNIREDGKDKKINTSLLIYRKIKTELKQLDGHSDISFLLIPVTGVLTVIMALILSLYTRRKKTNV